MRRNRGCNLARRLLLASTLALLATLLPSRVLAAAALLPALILVSREL